jgi:formate hydrogenlyase subunit 3/multisubunit Na+/H+ antiporter MnhD subunit
MTGIVAGLEILAAGAVSALLLRRFPRLALALSMAAVLAAAVLGAVAAGVVLSGQAPRPVQTLAWPMPIGAARLALDGLSAWFLMMVGVLGASVALYSIPYMGVFAGREPVPAFGALLCALMAALILLVCADDAVLFLVSWEAMTLAAFFLVAFHHDRPEVRRGAWMYLVATHIGTALFVVPLLAILAAAAGSTGFEPLAARAAALSKPAAAGLFVLGVLGFGTKAGLMPMHVWLPAAHPAAPTPISALLSGVVVKCGIYALVRLLTWLPPLPPACGLALLAAAALSGVMGVLYALAQHDLKRLLAYSTVENIAIITLGIGIGIMGQSTGREVLAALGYAGALLHAANHALFKGLLFLSAGAVLHGTGSVEIERLGGLARRTPVNALLFLIGAVAICGLPPLNGFVSEWIIYRALFGGAVGRGGAAGALLALGLVALALMGGLALACFAKVFGVVFLGEPRDPALAPRPTPALMRAGMALLAAACVAIGLFPGLLLPVVQRAAAVIVPSVESGPVAQACRDALAPAGTLTLLAGVLAGTACGLVLVRRLILQRAALRDGAPAGTSATWSCGYARPTPRMQYTASSFAGPLITSFRTLLWPQRDVVPPHGAFPSAGRLESQAPDIAEHDLFEPLLRGASRLCAMVRTVSWSGAEGAVPPAGGAPRRVGPLRTMLTGVVAALRRGSIQTHLAFIVLTMIVLFAIETAAQ